MTAITHLLARQQAAARRHDDRDNTRDMLEADPRLQAWANEWWSELDPKVLLRYEVEMIGRYISISQLSRLGDREMTPEVWLCNFRLSAYVNSADFDTLVDDIASGAKAWPT